MNLNFTSQQSECQDYFHSREKLPSRGSSKILHKIFRGKSEDFLSNENEKNQSKNASSETVLSPITTHSLFKRSSSEDILDKVTERPEGKIYCIKESSQEKDKDTQPIAPRRHKLIKPLHAPFSSDFTSSTNLRKKMKRSKSHNFAGESTELSSHFYLERANSDQDFQNEMLENKYPTLQRCTSEKETYFPANPRKSSSKKYDSQRIYQVNKPFPSSCSNLTFRVSSSEVNIHDKSAPNATQDSQTLAGNSHSSGTAQQTQTDGRVIDVKGTESNSVKEKRPWFEKYQVSKRETCEAQSSDKLEDSFEVSPEKSSPTDTLNLLVKYKGRPEVHKCIADKLTAIICELEEEISLTVPSSQHPDTNVTGRSDLQKSQASSTNPVVKTSSLPSRRPSSLLLERQMCRTNSAPALSPIEEVRAPPQCMGGTYLELGPPATEPPVCSSLRPVSCTSHDKKEGNWLTSYRSRSFDESHSEDIAISDVHSDHQHSLDNILEGTCSLSLRAPSHTLQYEGGECESQPRSLVLPAPVTYCDQYGNEKEIAYV